MNDLRQERRAGIAVPLFSLRSTQSWGLGEIGDIPALAAWLRSAHQTVLQILPLNELSPGEASPYSALSAMAIDPRYISVRQIEDAGDFESLWAAELDALRQATRIGYQSVHELKQRALRECFEQFHQREWLTQTARAESLARYVAAEDWWLDDYAIYRALRAEQGERAWTGWPTELRERQPHAIALARKRLSREILFYQYLQWIASAQWQQARETARGVEILGDFPFMVALDSADVWSRPRQFLLDASVGTPPDAFSKTGQEWGLPPYDWDEVRRSGFEWLRLRVRRLAALYDGFRVDHLVGFYRTYVRPLDGSDAYFSPGSESEQRALGEDVMGIVTSAGADVSVEDLGTVPDFVRASITELGVPGYRVFRWEAGDPATYPPPSVAMTGAHDLEPLAVWWESLLPRERGQIAAMPSVYRAHPRGGKGLVSSSAFDAAVRDAILTGMYGAGSNLLLLPIQDAFGWRERINHPATVGDWNWTYLLPFPVDRMEEHPEAVETAERLRALTDRSGRWPEGEFR